MLTETRGTIVMNALFDGYIPTRARFPAAYRRTDLRSPGTDHDLFVERSARARNVVCRRGVEVYEGMIVGEHSRDNDLDVNVVREKHMTNMRASSADEAIRLVPYRA